VQDALANCVHGRRWAGGEEGFGRGWVGWRGAAALFGWGNSEMPKW
jgi:hypothetical protein